MSGCTSTGRPGCHSALCRAAHAALKQLPAARYPADSTGLPDMSAQSQTGWVCGLVSFNSGRSSTLDIPGSSGGLQPMHLTVCAGSLEPAAAPGDIITLTDGTYRVLSTRQADWLTAELIPVEEAE